MPEELLRLNKSITSNLGKIQEKGKACFMYFAAKYIASILLLNLNSWLYLARVKDGIPRQFVCTYICTVCEDEMIITMAF